MELITRLLGDATDARHHETLHALEHKGAVEFVTVSRGDLARKRLRAVTDQGTEIAIALPRSEALRHDALLLLTDSRAIVLKVEAETWLTLSAKDAGAALRLGYHAGNLHWRVRFDGALLHIAVETEPSAYLARLEDFLNSGDAVIVTDAGRQDGEAATCMPTF